jgi:hypothetical protein
MEPPKEKARYAQPSGMIARCYRGPLAVLRGFQKAMVDLKEQCPLPTQDLSAPAAVNLSM